MSKYRFKVFSIKTLRFGGLSGAILMLQPFLYLFFSRRRDLSEYTTVDATSVIFIIYTFVSFAVSVLALIKEKVFFQKLLICSPLKWFIIYIMLCFVSIIWTVDVPLTTFRAFESLSIFLLIIATIINIFKKTGSPDMAIQWTLLYVFINIACSFISYAQWAHGLTIFTASQMVATIYFYMAFKSKSKLITITILLFSVLSMSTTAYLGMILGSVSLLYMPKKYKPWLVVGCFIAVVLILIVGIEPILENTIFKRHQEVLSANNISEVMEDSSGRNHIFNVSIKASVKQPWGYGFFAGEPYVIYGNGLEAINAHNSFLSALLGVGWLGVIILLIYFIAFIPILSSNYLKKYRIEMIGCYCIGMVQSMGNPGIGSRVILTWIPVTYLLVLISAIYIYQKFNIYNSQNNENFVGKSVISGL